MYRGQSLSEKASAASALIPSRQVRRVKVMTISG